MTALLNSSAPIPTYNQLHGINQGNNNNNIHVTNATGVGGSTQPLTAGVDVNGAVNVDEDDSEYSHKYQPIDARELSDAERLFVEYGTNGQLDLMVDLYNKANVKSNTMNHNHTISIDIDCCDQWGSTALMHASVRKHIHVIKWLCSCGADINKQDYRGITVLMECCWNNKIDYVKLLLSNKLQYKQVIDVNLMDEREYTALMQAAEEGM